MTGEALDRPQVLETALELAHGGLPVFPCIPRAKRPLTNHGFMDATTDERQIRAWWAKWPDANLAIPTGTPGPDVLDVDVRTTGSGVAGMEKLKSAGLLRGAERVVRTPSGGLHIWFVGTEQSCGALRDGHIDFKARGGYVLAPPSYVVESAYSGSYVELDRRAGVGASLDWAACRDLLAPRVPAPKRPFNGDADGKAESLAAWLLDQPPGNRNHALFWTACRAVEKGRDLSHIAVAAEQIGLPRFEVDRTIASAKRQARR